MHTPQRILLVEDDHIITHLMVSTLNKAGYEVIQKENGVQALEYLAQWSVDLILLDIYLPLLNGWDFLEKYHALPDHSAPVIAVSASEPERDLPDSVSVFLLKPFKMGSLIEAVRQVLEVHGS